MNNKLFSLTLLILLFLGLGLFILPQKEASSLENRGLKTNDDIVLNDLLKSTEEVMKDQFYQRDSLNRAYKKVELFFNKPFGIIFVNDIELEYLTDDVISLGDGYLVNAIVKYDEENIESASSRGYNVNQMALKYPDIKTYVYFPLRIEELLDTTSNGEPKFMTIFTDNLNSSVKYDYLKVNSIEDHKNYYYKTDMHWNNKGAYQGYADIINMISKDFDLDPVRTPIEEITYPYEFRGNVASQIAGASDADYISDYVFDLGEYKYYQVGYEVDFNTNKLEYAENGNTSMYSDYECYFGSNIYLRVFEFNQEDKPNILIFADSYINTNMSWIASHFNKTVIVDLREKDENFNLDRIIEDNDIDIILVTMRYTNLYLNGFMYIPLD